MVYTMILILLAISASIIYYCTNWSLSLKLKYPKVICKDILEDYSPNAEGVFAEADYQRLLDNSMKEFNLNREKELNKERTHYQGTMQCFCLREKADKVP